MTKICGGLFVCVLAFIGACRERVKDAAPEGASSASAALAGRATTAAPSSCVVTLTATLVFHGSDRTDGKASLAQPLPFRVPSSIPISAGSTKNGNAQLAFSRSGGGNTITCSYAVRGGGTSFAWTGCDDGDVAGSPESADTFALHIETADHGAGTSGTSIQLAATIDAVDGTGCNDGNACTQVDACLSGVCQGSDPVVCTASDQCHAPGTCDPSTGVCSNPPSTDGTPCNDGNACTQTDTCQVGTCVGANPMACAALDQCHLPGICSPATGLCSNPEKLACTMCTQLSNCEISATGAPRFFATDPTIAGAALEYPPTQTLNLQISPRDEVTVGMSFPHDDASWPDHASTYQLTTLSKVVSFNSDLPGSVTFGDQCATLTLPFRTDGMFPAERPAETVRIYQLLDGVLLSVPGPQTVDLADGLVSACVAHLSDYVVVQESPVRGFYQESAIWPQPSIPVCWEVLDPAFATQRAWVRDQIEKTWQKNSRIVFTGWDQCSPTSSGIRIAVEDRPLTAAEIAANDLNANAARTNALGQHLDGMQSGMVLDFTFNNWNPNCQPTVEYCIRAIATHEFGHALGFDHEQNRSDTPSTCTKDKNVQGDGIYGNWDLASVMNYCNPSYDGDGNLSPTDIDMVRALYGAPPGTDLLFTYETSASLPIVNTTGEVTFGATCPSNYTRRECVRTAQSADGSCYVIGWANPGDPSDCRCRVHFGWNITQGPDFTCVAEVRGDPVAPTCGTVGLPCCNGICNSGLVCDGANCVTAVPACGAPSEPCCKGPSPCAGGLTCSSTKCLPVPTCAPGDVQVVLNEYRSHYAPFWGTRGDDRFGFDVPPGYALDGVSLNKLSGTSNGDEYFNDPIPPPGSMGTQFFSAHWWFGLFGKAQYTVTATATCQTCPGTQTRCSGVCTDTGSDPVNCGACGNECSAPTTVCASGACQCPGSLTLCSGACTDTRSDDLNCGACGNACALPTFCQGASCQCPPTQTMCGGQCRDLRYDTSNCGACGNQCASNQVCGGGTCENAVCGRFGQGTAVDTNGTTFATLYDSLTKFTYQAGWFDQAGNGITSPMAWSYCSTLGSGWIVPSEDDLGVVAAAGWCGFPMPAHVNVGTQFAHSAVDFWTSTPRFAGSNPGIVVVDPYQQLDTPVTPDSTSDFGAILGVRCIHF